MLWLDTLIEHAADRIDIMPGGGITVSNRQEIIASLAWTSFMALKLYFRKVKKMLEIFEKYKANLEKFQIYGFKKKEKGFDYSQKMMNGDFRLEVN